MAAETPRKQKKVTPKQRSYKEQVTSPVSELDWQLAISDPLSEIGREYYALLMNKRAEYQDLVRFQEHLAYVTMVQQARVTEQIRRELEYAEERTREQQLRSWADSQLKNVPLEGTPAATQSLMKEILDLLQEAGKLVTAFTALTAQQRNLHAKWHEVHHARANHILAQLLTVGMIGPNGKPIKMTPAKQQQMRQALIPATPALVFKFIPGLAKKVLGLDADADISHAAKATPKPDHIVSEQIAKANDVMCELRMNAVCHDHADQNQHLMGGALLAVILANKMARKAKGISLDTVNPAAIGKMIEDDARLTVDINTKRVEIKNVEADMKAKMQKLNELVKQYQLEPEQLQQKRINPFDVATGPRPRNHKNNKSSG